jgi:hypothetical protein
VRARIAKRGVDHWVALEERSGVQLVGRILSIGDVGFTLQLHNDPQTTNVAYADVAYLRTGISGGEKAWIGASIGGFAAFSIWAAVHFHNQEKTLPPPTPALAILR